MNGQRTTAFLCWLLILAGLVACLINAVRSVGDLRQYGGTDLRVRVVGARALREGLNPYRLRNSPDLDETLVDPDESERSRCTYPPTLLTFYVPLAGLEYATQRWLWGLLEWLALLVSTAALAVAVAPGPSRCLFIAMAAGLIGGSQFWRLHVERGQYYVFVLLLVSLGISVLVRGKVPKLAGLCFGLAACLRPPVLVLLMPLWWTRSRSALFTGIATAAAGALFSLGWGGVGYWSDFVELSRAWESSILDGSFEQANDLVATVAVDGYRPERLRVSTPNLSIASVVHDWLPPVLQQRTQVAAAGIKVIWVVAMGILLWMWRRDQSLQFATDRSAMLCGIAAMLLTDYFLPIRIAYADVMFCLPLALLAQKLATRSALPVTILLAVAFLPSVLPLPGLPWQYWYLSSALRSLIVIYITIRYALAVVPPPGSPLV